MNPTRLLAAAALLGLAGCATTEYLGRTYPPTTHVDVYFAASDIPQAYEVMGEATTEGSEYLTFEAIEQQLVRDAMARGADAVVIEGMDTVVVGSSTTTDGAVPERPRYVVDRDGTVRNVGGSGHYTATTSTTTIRDRVIRSRLIKYRR